MTTHHGAGAGESMQHRLRVHGHQRQKRRAVLGFQGTRQTKVIAINGAANGSDSGKLAHQRSTVTARALGFACCGQLKRLCLCTTAGE